MKAFLSYSLNQDDLFLVSLLAEELQNAGVNSKGTISSSSSNEDIRAITNHSIRTCDLFIGILTGDGSNFQNEMVYHEWEIAINSNKSRIFLIEDTVNINPQFNEQFLVFNRFNPNQVLIQLRNFVQQKEREIRNKNNLALLIGGAALIGLIGHLSNKEKEE